MKPGLLFIISFIACSCNSRKLPGKLINDEYYYPDSKIESGKTYVYLNTNTGDTSYIDFFHAKIKGSIFVIQCSYDKNSVSDSAIYLDKRPVEYYINPSFSGKGKLWRATQIADTVIEDENGKPSEISEFHWKEYLRYVFTKTKTQIVKDTSVQWNGKSYEALITTTVMETNSNFLQTPDGHYRFEMELTNYLCKGIGCIKRSVTCNWRPGSIVTNLIEIRDTPKK